MLPVAKLTTRALDVHYGTFHALKNVTINVDTGQVTALIGPSGCGKTTLLRVFNRMNDLVPGCVVKGAVEIDGQSIYQRRADVEALRTRVGMVFQRPNPFPLSIFDNVVYGARVHGARRADLVDIAERCLDAVDLWRPFKDRLRTSALDLTPEEMQRLCVARAIAVEPEVLLMDEPCSALDPIATQRIEDLLRALAGRYTILIVTHNMQQAARVSDQTGFLLLGELIEMGPTAQIFTSPGDRRCEDYISGRYG